MRHWSWLAAAALLAAAGTEALANTYCYCKVATANDASLAAIIDYGEIQEWTDAYWAAHKTASDIECQDACYQKARADPNFKSAVFFCGKGVANGRQVAAYSAVGTGAYRPGLTAGVLINTRRDAKTVCTCPRGWFGNSNNVDGGVTGPDKRCKRMACQPITAGAGTSMPPTGTGTPNWWTWGNALWQTAPVATCVTAEAAPVVCRWR